MRSDERKQLPKICWGGRVKHQFKGLLFILISVFVAAGCSTGGNVRYAVVKGQAGDLETYQLVDAEADIKVSIAPGMGNTAYEFLVGGEDIFHLQVPLGELREKKVLGGNPLLSPWVSRLDGTEYYFEGKKYVLDESLGNLHHDKVGKILHGLVIWSPHWKVAKSGASAEEGAYLVSTLDFKSFPDLMAQFPFAHTLEITYRLIDGELEAGLKIRNEGETAMPIAVGFHPYFRIPEAPRDSWTLRLPAKNYYHFDGYSSVERRGVEKILPNAEAAKLGEVKLDHVFDGFPTDEAGRAHLALEGERQKIELSLSKEFDFVVVYAPQGEPFICIEPWTALPNAFNLNHNGIYPDLKTLEAGKTFTASFSIHPTGF